MELWQYYRILRKRKWLIILGSLICISIVGFMLFVKPEGYQAYTTVIEKLPDNQNVSIFTSPFLQVDPRIRLANLMELAKSSTVIENAYQAITKSGVKMKSDDPEAILQTLDVEPLIDTMIISLSVQASDPDDAVTVVNYVRHSLIKRYNELTYGSAAKTYGFIRSELPKAKAKLIRVQDALRDYKANNDAVMLTVQTNALIQEMTQYKTNLAQFEVQAKQAKARLANLKSELQVYPKKRQQAVTMQSNPVWQELQLELAKEQIELQKMLKSRTLQHPDVQALRSQIAETEKNLKSQAKTILGSDTWTADPTRDALVQNYINSLVELSAAEAGRVGAKKVVEGLTPDLSALPDKEAHLAELTAEEDAAKNTYSLLRQKLDESSIKANEADTISALETVDPGVVPPRDMSKKLLKFLLAVILSPIFCSGLAFLFNYLDNTVRTSAEAEELLKSPVFASIPLSIGQAIVGKKTNSVVGNAYQMLSMNFWIKSTGMKSRTVLIASAEPNVGRSTIAANLAMTLARDGGKIILVDADFRQPSLHKIFKVGNEKGLSDVLTGEATLRDALIPTSVQDLLLMTTGKIPHNPLRLLHSEAMSDFVCEINELADFVIFDSPAGVAFADSTLLGSLVKNVVLVYAAGTVPRGSEDEFRGRLEQVEANIVGAVLNKVRPEDSHGYYHFRSGYSDLAPVEQNNNDNPKPSKPRVITVSSDDEDLRIGA